MVKDTFRITVTGLALLLVMASVVGGIFYTTMVNEIRERTINSFASDLELGSLRIKTEVGEGRKRLLFLAQEPSLDGIVRARENGGLDPQGRSSEEQWRGLLEEAFENLVILNPYIAQIRLIDVENAGRELIRVESDGDTVIVARQDDLQQSDAMAEFEASFIPTPGEVHVDRIDLDVDHDRVVEPWKPVLRLAVPVFYSNGRVFGILVMDLHAAWLMEILRTSIPQSATLTLADPDGNIIYDEDAELTFRHLFGNPLLIQDLHPELELMSGADAETPYMGVVEDGRPGKTILYADRFNLEGETASERYLAVLTIPDAILTHEANETRSQIVLIALAFCIVSGAVLYYTSRSFAIPMLEVERFARELSDGRTIDTIARPRSPNIAVQQVCDTFVSIIASLSERERALEESSERLAAILSGTDDAIVYSDVSGMIEQANRAAENVFGYREEELLNRNVSTLVGPEHKEHHDRYIEDYLRTGIEKVIGKRRELTGQRKNGSVFDLELRVAETFRNGRRKFVGIMTDISERKRIDRLKSEFVSTVSHELRTPLSAIKGSLSLILARRKSLSGHESQELLEMAHKNCIRLIALINDILDIDRISSGKMSFDFKPVDLMQVLQDSVRECTGMATSFDVEIAVGPRPREALVMGDEKRLVQVLNNILSNAIKFSPAGDVVSVTVARPEEAWRVSVADNGPGILPEFQERLFERFTQENSTVTRPTGGSGLGLAISKSIMDAHRGKITFETSPSGTTFHVELDAFLQDTKRVPRHSDMSGGKRVLICDERREAAKLLAEVLNTAGYTASIASDARDAADRLSIARTDIAVLQSTNGTFERRVLEHVRTCDPATMVPLLILTNGSAEPSDLDALAAGLPVRRLPKPFTSRDLVDSVDMLAFGTRLPEGKILYVEDEADQQRIIENLTQGLASCTVTRTLQEARECLRETDFDVVILDRKLPDGYGCELVEDIKTLGKRPEIMILSIDTPPAEIRSQVGVTLLKTQAGNEEILMHLRKLLNKASAGQPDLQKDQ
jgi:PAS domain S-box-containing protein